MKKIRVRKKRFHPLRKFLSVILKGKAGITVPDLEGKYTAQIIKEEPGIFYLKNTLKRKEKHGRDNITVFA